MSKGQLFAWRHQWANDAREEAERDAVAIDCEAADDGMTQQHFAQDADINTIVARFGITDHSQLPGVTDPIYFGDFTDAPSYRQALDNIREAQERFDLLPADVRRRFNHDPVTLFEWTNDPKNLDEAVNLGLMTKVLTEQQLKPPAPPAGETTP